MREELNITLGGQQVTLISDSDSKIDCYYIQGWDNRKSAPTIIYCNPNGGYYEFIYYQLEMLSFYVNNGINIFLWNYRGYGDSEGKPTPDNVAKDGVLVANYIRNLKGTAKIGVHGESIGGLPACYIANNS
mmetsp:Transcript_32562/g.5897  ORF Transcript_32562/g.5897 Transcript_32562/m.5897 type:complete len:131 (+) Transcript_32562:340-732(+)